MRFILGFIFYGILFYLIYLLFPDAFSKMVSWADSLTEILKDLYAQLSARIQEWRGRGDSHQHASLFIAMWLMRKI